MTHATDRRALLSFTLHSNARIPPVDVVSAVDASLLLRITHEGLTGLIAVITLQRIFSQHHFFFSKQHDNNDIEAVMVRLLERFQD